MNFEDALGLEKLEDSTVKETLAAAGIITKGDSLSDSISSQFSKALEKAGVTLDVTANAIAREIIGGEKSTDRLNATKLALQGHGVIRDLDNKTPAPPVINIHIGGTGKTLVNLVMPN